MLLFLFLFYFCEVTQTAESEGTVPYDFSHSDKNCKSEGLPKTALMFFNFLDRLTKLTKSFYILGFALYREKMQIRTSPGKRHIQQSADRDRTRSSWLSCCCGGMVSPAAAVLCDRVHRGLPAREACPHFPCPEFLRALNHKLPVCDLLSPAAPGAQVNTCSLQFLWRSA